MIIESVSPLQVLLICVINANNVFFIVISKWIKDKRKIKSKVDCYVLSTI